MAEFSKYHLHSIGALFLHNNREQDDGVVHSNKEIDNSRTYLNYHLKKGSVDDIKDKIKDCFIFRHKNLCVLGEMIVTLPKDVRREDERDFFQSCYDFYKRDFGEENIINAVVHKDETTPHLHLDFVPIIQSEDITRSGIVKNLDSEHIYYKSLRAWKEENPDKPLKRLCINELVNRKYLQTMHPRLSAYVENELGYETEIINGATANGNKHINELKAESLKEVIAELEQRRINLETELKTFFDFMKRNNLTEDDLGVTPLLSKLDELQKQNELYKEIIMRNRYSYTREDLEKLKSINLEPSTVSKINYFYNSMYEANIEDNAIIIFELPQDGNRKSPQQKMIDSDSDIERQYKLAISSTAKLLVRPSRTSNRMYVFMKTDNDRQTIDRFLELEAEIKSNESMRKRKIYLEEFDCDKYQIGKNFSSDLDNQINYFTKHYVSSDEDREKELSKEKE